MLPIETNPSDTYVPFVIERDLPWWSFETRRRGSRMARSRRVIGRALIRAGRAVAAEHRAPVLG